MIINWGTETGKGQKERKKDREKPVKNRAGAAYGNINGCDGGDGGSGIAFAHLPHQYTSLSTYEFYNVDKQ